MNNTNPDYYVISFDKGEALPFGFVWFVELGGRPEWVNEFTYYATREECVARANSHLHFTNPVLLCEDPTDV